MGGGRQPTTRYLKQVEAPTEAGRPTLEPATVSAARPAWNPAGKRCRSSERVPWKPELRASGV
jgi:hypothetical protein